MAGLKTILFAEDDRPISAMYARMLTKAGYELDFAGDGIEALGKAQTSTYELILLDIMMPGKTGIEVLHDLRSDSRFDMTKIIILTNLAQDKTSREALKAEADGYLVKADITPSQLVEIVDGLIGKKS